MTAAWIVVCWPLVRGGGSYYLTDATGQHGAWRRKPGASFWSWFRTVEAAQAMADKLNSRGAR